MKELILQIDQERMAFEKRIRDLEATNKALQDKLEGRPIDFLDLKVPNLYHGFAHTMKPDDKRHGDWLEDRLTRGFDDTETWSLRNTIASFIVPRLERYQEIANGFLKRAPELSADVDAFLEAMRYVRDEKDCKEEDWAVVKKGLEAFPRMFMSLWW